MTLTREMIAAVQDRKRRLVEIPEWSGPVYVQEMTAAQADRLSELNFVEDESGSGKMKFRWDGYSARLAVFTVCDDQGAPLFTEADMPMLAAKSAAALARIVAAARELNGLTEAAVEADAKN
jgi:hypothetical protein